MFSNLQKRLEKVNHTVLVLSGKGGVGESQSVMLRCVTSVSGKSTIAVHLANALVANGSRVGLLDVDLVSVCVILCEHCDNAR
jgi:Mrp family chromosome partitioning ATPase